MKAGNRRSISHVITDLDVGGAESMLYRLVGMMQGSGWRSDVSCLLDAGELGRKIQALGVPVHSLGMRRGSVNPGRVLKLIRHFRRRRPGAVQTWMYHADLVGGIAAKAAGIGPVVWGVRQSNLNPKENKATLIWIARICARLSRRLPARIVCCSNAARTAHAAFGYAEERMVVIPNGFDLAAFKPDADARLQVRKELGMSDDALVVGLVGRFDYLKDHHNFISAVSSVAPANPAVRFVLCGEGVAWDNPTLSGWIRDAGLKDRSHLLGHRSDVPRIMAALDIACLSSRSEGFPNVVGEAMSCGVPCVITDVGDGADLVGDTGEVVQPQQPAALAAGLRRLTDMDAEARRNLGAKARRRIADRFSIQSVAERYLNLYGELCNGVRNSGTG